jgi:hypothetical protein
MEPIECSETSAYKIHTPGNYPEDNILQNLLNCLNAASDPLCQAYQKTEEEISL